MSEVVALPSAAPIHTYSRGAKIFELAAQSFGLNVKPQQVDEWSTLIRAAFSLDNILDGTAPQAEREAAFDTGVAALLLPLAQDWRTEKAERVLSAAQHVKEIAAEKRQTSSAKHLGALALYEGAETARFLQLEESGESKIAGFNSWMRVLLRFGVVIDTAVDLHKDYENNLTAVPPTRINQSVIAAQGLSAGILLGVKTPVQLLSPLYAAAKAITSDTNKDKLRSQ